MGFLDKVRHALKEFGEEIRGENDFREQTEILVDNEMGLKELAGMYHAYLSSGNMDMFNSAVSFKDNNYSYIITTNEGIQKGMIDVYGTNNLTEILMRVKDNVFGTSFENEVNHIANALSTIIVENSLYEELKRGDYLDENGELKTFSASYRNDNSSDESGINYIVKEIMDSLDKYDNFHGEMLSVIDEKNPNVLNKEFQSLSKMLKDDLDKKKILSVSHKLNKGYNTISYGGCSKDVELLFLVNFMFKEQGLEKIFITVKRNSKILTKEYTEYKEEDNVRNKLPDHSLAIAQELMNKYNSKN